MNHLKILAFTLIVASFDVETTFEQVRECDCDDVAKRNASEPSTAKRQQKQGSNCEKKCKANNEKIGDYAVGKQQNLETNVRGKVFITCL